MIETEKLEQRVCLFYEKGKSESEKCKALLDKSRVDYTIIPCKGLIEPELAINDTRYEGFKKVKELLEEYRKIKVEKGE